MGEPRGGGAGHETPLLGARTLVSTSSSRLPLVRRPSLGQTDAGSVASGRARGPVTDSGVSLLGTAARERTLKRTSSSAGLNSAESEVSKRQLSSTRNDLEELKVKHERYVLSATTTQTALQSQLQDYITKTERLERHRTLLMGQAREAEEREAERRAASEREVTDLQSQVRKLRAEASSLKDKNVELGATCRELEHEAAQANARAKSEEGNAAALEAELERMQEEMMEKAQDLSAEKEKRSRVEAELERATLEQKDASNSQVIQDELRRQVTHLRTLEKDNAKLSRKLETFEKQHANVEILKERNKALEKKVAGIDTLRRQIAAAESEVGELQREKSEWMSFLGPNADAEHSTPRSLSRSLAATRIENATYREKLDTVGLELQRRDRMIGELEARIVSLEQELAGERTTRMKAEARAKQEENRQQLHTKEIEMLKRQLSSYGTEEQIQGGADFDSQKTARIEELESILEAYKSEVSELAKQVAHWRGLVERYGGSTTEIVNLEAQDKSQDDNSTAVIVSRSLEDQLRRNESLQTDLEQARNEKALMMKEIEALELHVDRLSYAHGSGEYDPATTKVIELRQNPASQDYAIRTATLDRLREENQALLSTVAELQNRKGAALDNIGTPMVPKASLDAIQADLEAANATVKQKEKMELRLQTAFRDKADEFRKAVQSLLGFRLDFLSTGRVRVTSVYVPSNDYSLTFGSSAGDVATMEMTTPALKAEIEGLSSYWVGERGCIPGLLASLTLAWVDKPPTASQ